MFIKVISKKGVSFLLNTDTIRRVYQVEENLLRIFCVPDEYTFSSFIEIKGNLDEFYQRLINADRKDQH